MAASPDVDVTAAESPTAEGASAVRRVGTKMIVVLGALVALGPLTIDMYLPALPKIADELSVSSSVAQLTLTGTLAGLALGQLIVGPLSDSLGRRRPLMAGIVLHMLASLLCLFAPNIAVLGVARGLQGMGAAAAMVVAIAVVGDLFAESVAATVMSRLMLVLGVAPVVAPSLGAAVLLKASWHWVFAALVVMAGALLLLAALALPETLPESHRRPLKVRSIAATYVELLRDARFVILVLVAALGMSAPVRLHRRRVVRAAGPLRPGPAGVRAGVRRWRGRADRRDAVQRGAAAAVHAADHRGVGAGGGIAGRRGLRRAGSRPHRRAARASWCRCGRSWPRWAWSFPTRPPWRCRGIPTPRVPPRRCSVRLSSASARPLRRWSGCSATTRSR